MRFGECQDPVERIKSYIAAAGSEIPNAGCAIHQHFQDAAHDVQELCVFLVDGVPTHLHDEPGVRAGRVRLENLWIKRIIGSREHGLNDRCQWHRSIAGGSSHPLVTL